MVATAADPAKDTGAAVMGKPQAADQRATSIRSSESGAPATVAGPVQMYRWPQGQGMFTVSATPPANYQALPFDLGPRACDPPICSGGGWTPEGEVDCYDGYDDTYNGGCNSDPPAWNSTISCGQKICGSSGNFQNNGNVRDTDWFVWTITEDTEYTFTVRADFPVLMGLVETYPIGSGNCDDMSGYVNPAQLGDACQTVSITQCVPAGTYWFFVSTQGFEGVPCGSKYEASLTCVPCDAPDTPVCPANTLAQQRAYSQYEEWVASVSNSKFYNWTDGIKRFEHFHGVSAANGIEDVHWWGLSAVYDDWGYLVECPLNPGTFKIQFWAHNEYTNRPDITDPNNLVCQYTLTAPQVTVSDSGHKYGDFTLWMWHVQLPTACYMEEGWLSVQNTDYCMFWWAGSPEGGTIHLELDERNGNLEFEEAKGDLSYCLTGTYTPITGACCNAYEQHPPGCVSPSLLEECIDYGDFFYANVTCAQINYCQTVLPVAACCVGTDCFDDVNYFFCLHEGGVWHQGESCYQGYQCPGLPPEGPDPITCDSDAKFAQGLTSGWTWLFPSWVENNDYRWVDNYQLSSGTSVVRLHYWGFGTAAWPNWDDCDFGGDYNGRVDVRVKFYETDPNSTLPPPAPKWYAPLCTYDTTAKVKVTQYWFPSIQIYIRRFTVLLPSPCALANGWFSVQEILGSGTCLMGTLSGQGGNNRAFTCDASGCTVWQGSSPSTDEAFCLYTTVLYGACCDLRDGSCQNNVAQNNCAQNYHAFYPNLTCSQLYQYGVCNAVPGACCDLVSGDCQITLWSACQGANKEWLGPNSTCDECCVAACPQGGIPEGEPNCGPGYNDTYNGGCNSTPPVFQPLAPGAYMCGKNGNYEYSPGTWYRDTDWFQFTVPGITVVKWHVKAEFLQHMTILGDCAAAGMPPGDANCDGLVDGFDIQPFVQALTNPAAWQAAYPDCDMYCVCDINCDESVDGFDIQGFVQCLTGTCPPCSVCGPLYQWGVEGLAGYCEDGPASAILEGGGKNWGFVSNFYETKEGYQYYPPCGTPYVAYYEFIGAGACVLPDQTCVLASQNVCLALGGTYQGNGTSCP